MDKKLGKELAEFLNKNTDNLWCCDTLDNGDGDVEPLFLEEEREIIAVEWLAGCAPYVVVRPGEIRGPIMTLPWAEDILQKLRNIDCLVGQWYTAEMAAAGRI